MAISFIPQSIYSCSTLVVGWPSHSSASHTNTDKYSVRAAEGRGLRPTVAVARAFPRCEAVIQSRKLPLPAKTKEQHRINMYGSGLIH